MEKQDGLEAVVAVVAAVARERVSAAAERVDREATWPEPAIRALQSAGVGGLTAPKECGGLGFGLEGVLRCCEVLGYECASTALCIGMHWVGTAVIAAKATPVQRDKYLVPISAGRHLTTLALSEPGSGVHFCSPKTRLVKVPGGNLQLDGHKAFVTNGGHADSYVLSASGLEAPVHGRCSFVLAQAASKGMEWGEPWSGLGMRGNSSRSLQLHGVTVLGEDLLGQTGDQSWYVFEVVAPYFLMAMAGSYLGLARRIFDELRAHVEGRIYSHNGSELATQTVVQHRLGLLWPKLERTRALAHSAAIAGDADPEGGRLAVLSAKAEVADCVVDLANEAMTLMGGIGYSKSSKMARLLRDARAAHVMSPSTDLLRLWIGREILGRPLLAE